MRLARPPSPDGMARIPSTEIEAYQRLRRVRFTDWELDMLTTLDNAAIEISNRKST